MTKFKLPNDLYQYQKEDSDKMTSPGNWLDFSQMGVGKTPITIAACEKAGYELILIVCPNSLRFNWAKQISEWVGENYVTSKGNSYTRTAPIVHSLKDISKRYKIINYEMLRSDSHYEILDMIPFECIVFDEIHKLRNPKTKLVRNVWKYVKNHSKAKIIGLTGSPIMNYPNDLYTPLSITHPDMFKPDLRSWRYFMYEYCTWSDGKHGPYVYGTRHLNELRRKTESFIIYRTKKEVLPFLPDKYYQRIELEMPSDQRRLYDQMAQELCILLDSGETLSSPSVLSTLTRLRQINLDPRIVGAASSSAKTEFLYELVESTDEKLVIFSCFEKYINFVSRYFTEIGIKHVTITGTTPPDKKVYLAEKFQNEDDIRLCLGTIKVAGEGIDLFASSTVILVDRWWNEPTNQQAIDRLHRIGQKEAVQVIYLICKNSMDDILDDVLQKKESASQQYYSEHMIVNTIVDGVTKQ